MEIERIIKKLGDKVVLTELLKWFEETRHESLDLHIDEYSDSEIEDTLEDILWWLSDAEISEFTQYISNYNLNENFKDTLRNFSIYNTDYSGQYGMLYSTLEIILNSKRNKKFILKILMDLLTVNSEPIEKILERLYNSVLPKQFSEEILKELDATDNDPENRSILLNFFRLILDIRNSYERINITRHA